MRRAIRSAVLTAVGALAGYRNGTTTQSPGNLLLFKGTIGDAWSGVYAGWAVIVCAAENCGFGQLPRPFGPMSQPRFYEKGPATCYAVRPGWM